MPPDIAVDPYLAALPIGTYEDHTHAEQLLDLVESEEIVRIVEFAEFVDTSEAAGTEKAGPAVDRAVRTADPSAQEIGRPVVHNLFEVAGSVGNTVERDAAFPVPESCHAAVDEAAEDVAALAAGFHGCLAASDSFDWDEAEADVGHVGDVNWVTDVVERQAPGFEHCPALVSASL